MIDLSRWPIESDREEWRHIRGYIHGSCAYEGETMSYWGLTVTYCDEKNNQFLSLGGAAWETKKERDENLSTIPACPEGPYLLDVEDEDSIVADRPIDQKTVEALLGNSVGNLIRNARRKEDFRG